MAISLIQKKTVYNTATATQNLTASFNATITAGNLIVVPINTYISTVSSVTDNKGNTYSLIGSPAVNGSDRTYIYYAKNVVGGTVTVTVNFNAGNHIRSFGIYEYAGADKTAPFDKSVTGSGTGTSVTPGTVTPTNNNSLIVSVGGDYTPGGTAAITAQTGYTLRDSQADNVTHERYYFEDFVQTTATGTTPLFTIANSANYRVVAAVFKPTPPTPKIETLTDAFTGTTIDSIKWNTYSMNSGAVAENDDLETTPVAHTSLSWGGIYSKNKYDLTSSKCFVKLTNAGAGDTYVDLTLSTQPLPSDNFLSIGVDTGLGMLQAGDEVSGVFTVRNEIPYVPANHLWLQIRESGGTVYFEYSADGVTWSVLDSRAPALPITNLYVVLDDFEYDTTGTPGVATFDNLNIA